MPLKIVLDTSTLVSAFFWKGNEAELLRKIEHGKARLYLTRQILKEFEEVIQRPKFSKVVLLSGLNSSQIMQKLLSMSYLVIALKLNIDVCRDKKDNKFLECAVRAKADYIVSGDEDLLSLKEYNDIPIVKTSKMLELIKK